MEILEQHLNIENDNLMQANYIIFNLEKTLEKNDYGFILTKIKLKNNNVYCIIIESNSRDKIDTIKSYLPDDNKMDFDLFQEYFINGMDKYLSFNNEAYFRVINLNDDNESKYVFTDYRDAIGYLESIDLS